MKTILLNESLGVFEAIEVIGKKLGISNPEEYGLKVRK